MNREENDYIDLDTHVDIYKDGVVTPMHIFNHQDIDDKYIKFNKTGGDVYGATPENEAISEIIIYKNFPKNTKYRIYLYSYIGDFNDVLGEFYIYHYKEGFLDNFITNKCNFLLISVLYL